MRFCKYCGTEISETDRRCPHCGRDLANGVTGETNQRGGYGAPFRARTKITREHAKILLGIVAPIVCVFVFIAAGNLGKCQYNGCRSKVVPGSDYCYSHKCAIASCEAQCTDYSRYCYLHYLLYDDDAQEEYSGDFVSSYELSISNVRLSSNSNYTIAEGTLTNNSDRTVSFVKIKGAFKTGIGSVVDTDWTYAVGSEGLAPGESCKWRMSVDKDRSIEACTATVTDFDY